MKKKISALLTALFLTTIILANITEAKEMKNTALSIKQKSIVTIAAFTANGDLAKLETALHKGLDAGLTVNEIKEILVQMYAYCGFPRSLNAINTFMSVVDERKARGIHDESGPEASPMPSSINKNEYGKNIRMKLFGRTTEAPPSGYQLFTPVIDDFLKEHLFADIFYRDNLDHLSREIATVAALASMDGTNPQLRSHISAAMITGLTEAQMFDLIKVIDSNIGKKQGKNASIVFSQLLSSKAN